MRIGNREMLVIGDRVLVKPDNPEERTKVGLVLPQSVMEKDPVQSGRVVATGPGTPVPSFGTEDHEPWEDAPDKPMRYIPVQSEVGDYGGGALSLDARTALVGQPTVSVSLFVDRRSLLQL